ncbi:MAG: DUF2267 domain-containing protein [Nocardioidaceae bacterium]
MTHDEFVGAFAERIGVSPEDAQRLLRAGLEVLSERISHGELRHVASQLPDELAAQLQGGDENAEAFTTEEFARRITQRTDADIPLATLVMRALFTTLRQALSAGEYDDLLSQLPREYRDMVPSTSWRGGPIPAWGLGE